MNVSLVVTGLLMMIPNMSFANSLYPALFTSALIRRLEVAGRWVLAPGALSTP